MPVDDIVRRSQFQPWVDDDGVGQYARRGLLASLLQHLRSPSLSTVLLLGSLQGYLRQFWQALANRLPANIVGLLPAGLAGFNLGDSSDSTKSMSAVALGWVSFTILSFIGAKLYAAYVWLDPLDAILRQTWIDTRHSQHAASHKWLTTLIEQSPKYGKSRNLEASNFQSIRERETSQYTNDYDDGGGGWGDPYYRSRNNRKNKTKNVELTATATQAAVPIFFRPRDLEEFWFFYGGTIFRLRQQAAVPSRRQRNMNNGWNTWGAGGGGNYDESQPSDAAIHVRAFCRSRKPLLRFLAHVQEVYEAGFKKNLYLQVSTYDVYSHWKQSPLRQGRSLDSIIIPEETKKRLVDDFTDFLSSQDWYTSRGVSWKRGYMLSGPPGCGKTSTIMALASHFDLPVYVIPVASSKFNDQALVNAVTGLSGKCIMVLEDIDALGLNDEHRKPKRYDSDDGMDYDHPWGSPVKSSPLTLSTLLNVLEGLSSSEGRIVIATTNFLDALDEALIRPGRFDCFIEYRKATKIQARELFLQFYKDYRSKVTDEDAEDVESLEKEEERRAAGTEVVELLATEWQGLIEEEEFSVAALQGHLIANKANPFAAVSSTPDFIKKARTDASKGKGKPALDLRIPKHVSKRSPRKSIRRRRSMSF